LVGGPAGRDILEGVTVTAAPTLAPPAVRPLRLGSYEVWPPVVLAPMAGITNPAFRRLCREHGAGLYVCEMITTVALVERNPKTLKMIAFGPDERPRSLQLYGIDPDITAKAVRIVVEQNLADHIDLNFGCPKLTDCKLPPVIKAAKWGLWRADPAQHA
jgi:hypothetical protein